MLLKSKILLILLGFLILHIGLGYCIQHFVVFHNYVATEEREAHKNIQRCAKAIEREIEHLDTFCFDWACWDDSYEFVNDKNDEFIQANLGDGTFYDNALSLICFCDTEGNVVWDKFIDLKTGEHKELRACPSMILKEKLYSKEAINQQDSSGISIKGIVMMDYGPVIVSIAPITQSDYSGPVRGYLVMVRMLDKDFVQMLSEQTAVPLKIWSLRTEDIPSEIKQVSLEVIKDDSAIIKKIDQDHAKIYSKFNDIDGKPILLLEADILQYITKGAKTIIIFALLWILVGSIAMLLILFGLLQKVIVKPIAALGNRIKDIRKNNDCKEQLSINTKDEIGELSRDFNSMVSQLALAHDELQIHSDNLQSVNDKLQDEVNKRGKAEKKLAREHSVLRTLMDNLPHQIFVKDTEGTFIYANKACAQDLQTKNPEDLIGKTDFDFMPREFAQNHRQEELKIINTGKTITTVKNCDNCNDFLRCRNRTDKKTWHSCMKIPWYDQRQDLAGVIGLNLNITNIQDTKEELEQYREQMSRMERLAALGTMGATVAHELTQPLTVISLTIDNLLDDFKRKPYPKTIKDSLIDCRDKSTDATDIIDRFRNFARRSSQKEIVELNIHETLEKITKLLNKSAKKASMKITLEGMQDLPLAYFNENDIEQIFFLIIQNAIQASEGKEETQLKITACINDDDIEIQFKDTCGGIAPENIKKVFEPFFTTKPSGRGTGLGLCIVQQILAKYGRKIKVDSQYGQGTTFYINLPVYGKNE